MEFHGKTYIVTGGNSGIGLAVVKTLLSSGATVHIIDLAASIPPDLVGFEPKSRLHCHSPIDVSSREQVVTVFETITTTSPDLHGIVNAAGTIPDMDPIALPEPDAQFRHILEVNLFGTWNTGSAFLNYIATKHPELKESVSKLPPPTVELASVVNVSSMAAVKTTLGFASYNTSKHAVVGLTKSWAKDFIQRGVRVNCVAPGFTNTPLLLHGVEPLLSSIFWAARRLGAWRGRRKSQR
ncbi:hypothetical protein AOCH_002262 [Aspergillus ochraceoroseus]|uniref:NAD(P)-binding protein n=1 Tax=Aspergillus ochraceoroseus TaxID=138278 RepID=A0A0F8UMN9_9EURO|nr:hypothetical protein AOCH_002262 [Aspergillus ochraceoroseus]